MQHDESTRGPGYPSHVVKLVALTSAMMPRGYQVFCRQIYLFETAEDEQPTKAVTLSHGKTAISEKMRQIGLDFPSQAGHKYGFLKNQYHLFQ